MVFMAKKCVSASISFFPAVSVCWKAIRTVAAKIKQKGTIILFFISATLPFSIFSKTEDLLFIMRFIAVCFLQAPHDQVGTLAKCQRNHAVLPIKPEGFKVRVSPWKQQHISPQAALCKA